MGKFENKKEENINNRTVKIRCAFVRKCFGWFWLHFRKLFVGETLNSNAASLETKNRRIIPKLYSSKELTNPNGNNEQLLPPQQRTFKAPLHHHHQKKRKNKQYSIL
jgi:hypothetical protein